LEQTEQELFCFTGNMSWLHLVEDNIPVLRALEDLLKRKVHIRMVGRVDLSVMENLNKISRLLTKYAGQIEIHHAMQPLRGFIIDNKVVRLKDEKEAKLYRKGELKGDLRVFYDIYDPEWIYWIQQVFWNLYRGSPTAEQRIEELKKIF
ncbi:MAG: hypothetical protein Q7K43_05170, partial [Candidatus Woesearchaeota archaeon]|nr:hypothetical protein [Candidatus Woesearchaeota archaeon]